MPELKFDEQGKHFYETGVDHGVLFVMGDDGVYGKGVAWNGLTSVTESPEGAEESAIYADNIKYLSLRSVENFNATIEAYTYPDEFGVCDGSASLTEGVTIGQQSRKTFAFCYRTKKGNDVNPDLGYVYHIIYGATASPSERAYETVNDSPDAITFSWSITTVPVEVTGHNKTSHLEIDTTKFTESGKQAKLKTVIDALYGTDGEGSGQGTDPTLKMPDEILALLK